jgi:hypothetical protein
MLNSDKNSKLSIQISVVQASDIDSKDIWVWRNDERTRQMSEVIHFISWEEHRLWFEKSLGNTYRYMYIGTVKSLGKIGICFFDMEFDKNAAKVSLNINPNCRKKNLSSKFLAEAMKIFFHSHKVDLFAKIKKINTVSIKCFSKIGFTYDYEDGDYDYYKYSYSLEDSNF